MKTRLTDLQPELILLILGFLTPEKIAWLTLLNSQFNTLISTNPTLWHDKYKKHFPHQFKKASKQNPHWPIAFQLEYQDNYKNLPPGVPAIFSLVKENDIASLSLIPLTHFIFSLADKNQSLMGCILQQRNKSLFDYVYQTIKQAYVLAGDDIYFHTYNVFACSDGRSTLLGHAIALRQPISTIKDLIQKGSDLTVVCYNQSIPPLVLAAHLGYLTLVEYLATEYPHLLESCDTKQQTSLLWAAAKNHLEILRFLISLNTNLEAATDFPTEVCHGYTALCWAVKRGHVAIVEELLAAGANTFVTIGPEKLIPIHLAIIKGRIDIVKLMLNHDRRLLNATDFHQRKCLFFAFFHMQPEVIKLLLSKGATIDNPCMLILLESTNIELWNAVLEIQFKFPSTVTFNDNPLLIPALEKTLRWAKQNEHDRLLNWLPIVDELFLSAPKVSFSKAEVFSSPALINNDILILNRFVDWRLTLFNAAKSGNKEEVKGIVCSRHYSVGLQSTLIKLADVIFKFAIDDADKVALSFAAAKALLICAQAKGPLDKTALEPYKDALKSKELGSIYNRLLSLKR